MVYKRVKSERPPSSPGEVLEEIWLKELNLSRSEFSQMLVEASNNKIKLSSMKTKVSEVINGKRAMTADFAILIGKVLNTNPRLWMSLQVNRDLWDAERKVA